MLHRMENARRKQLAWIKAILDQTGWNQTELARRAGVNPSTISQFRKDPDNMSVLSTETVTKVTAVSPIPHYENLRSGIPPGFSEREAEPLDRVDDDPVLRRLVSAATGGQNGLDAWIMRNRALENVGYQPGDVLMVDLNLHPDDGDVVCAQVFDRLGNAETAFRLYFRPYLVGSSALRQYHRPILVDDRVVVRGVVVASIRPRMKLAS